MSKVLLNYEPSTGSIMTNDGCIIATHYGLAEHHESNESTTIVQKPSTNDLIVFKNAGFEMDDILKLKQSGVI